MLDPTRKLLLEILQIQRDRATRLIDVQTGELTTTLAVHDGQLVAANASKPGEPIGRILRRKGMISPAHYMDVLERISEVLSVGERVRFGEVAVGLGYAKPEDVAECLTEQVRGLVVRMFQGASPTWTVREASEGRSRSGEVTMHVEAIFLDAVRWLDDARKGALGLDDAKERALQPAWPLPEIDVRFELTPDEAEAVRVVLAGDATVAEIGAKRFPDNVDIHAVLTALIAAGAASFRERGKAEVLQRSVRKRVPAPPPSWAKVDDESAKRAVVKVMKAREASPAIPVERSVGTLLEQALGAERDFQRGRELFRAGDVAAALRHFEQAMAVDPTAEEYGLFVAWSRHQLAGDDLAPADVAELEERAGRTLAQNPKAAFGYFVLAESLRIRGDSDAARAQLTRALALDAELFESMREKRVRRLRASLPDVYEPSASALVPVVAESKAEVSASALEPEPAAAPPATSPADVCVAEPPRPVPPKSRRTLLLVVALLAISVAGAVAAAVLVPGGAPAIAAKASSTVAASAPPPLASAVAAAPSSAPLASAAPIASAVPNSDGGAGAGVVVLPKSAFGHRVFVDGKLVEPKDARIEVACGKREIQIGSRATPRPIDVACGGTTALE